MVTVNNQFERLVKDPYNLEEGQSVDPEGRPISVLRPSHPQVSGGSGISQTRGVSVSPTPPPPLPPTSRKERIVKADTRFERMRKDPYSKEFAKQEEGSIKRLQERGVRDLSRVQEGEGWRASVVRGALSTGVGRYSQELVKKPKETVVETALVVGGFGVGRLAGAATKLPGVRQVARFGEKYPYVRSLAAQTGYGVGVVKGEEYVSGVLSTSEERVAREQLRQAGSLQKVYAAGAPEGGIPGMPDMSGMNMGGGAPADSGPTVEEVD